MTHMCIIGLIGKNFDVAIIAAFTATLPGAHS